MKWRPDSEAEQCGMWLDMEKDASWLIPLKHTYTLCHAALISQIVIKQRNLMQLKFTIMKLKCHFFTIICICHFRHVDLPPKAARPWENRIQDRRLGISRLEACIRVSGPFYTCHQPVVYLKCPRGSEGQKLPSVGQGQSFGRSLGTSPVHECLNFDVLEEKIVKRQKIPSLNCRLIQAFPITGPQTWNDLSKDVPSAETLATICRLLKTHLFRKSFPN